MPTYDYECIHCGHAFEEFQRMTAEPLSACPKCGKAVKRLIGAGMGVIFKGSGFYTTDNKKTSAAPSEPKTSDSKPKEKTEKTSSNTESKSESKSSEVKSGKSD